jgi:pimeloyl-ACP methyl ester carboxylesterase
MGDLRAGYRFLAVRDAGYRVACTDLRGHGDSDTTFASYGDAETASDIIALVEQLGGPAIIVGNSMGAGAGALAAAMEPSLVRGLVLLGPFVRNGQTSTLQRLMLRVAMAPPWAATSWKAYMPKLLRRATPIRLRRIPRPRSGKPAPTGIPEGVLAHHAHQPRPSRSTPRRRLATHAGRDGRQGPRLPGPARRSRLDRTNLARRRRHGPRRWPLPPIATTRPHDRGHSEVSRDGPLTGHRRADRSLTPAQSFTRLTIGVEGTKHSFRCTRSCVRPGIRRAQRRPCNARKPRTASAQSGDRSPRDGPANERPALPAN